MQDTVFSAAYSGARQPFSPYHFLHAWWNLAGGALAGGCKQQDAHEFFLFVLEMLTATAGPEGSAARAFRGGLRSEIVCGVCSHVSTTQDAFTNLSIDVPPPQRLLPPPVIARANANSINGKVGAAAAKASRGLVGAAKAARLAKIQREAAAAAAAAQAGGADASQTPIQDPSTTELDTTALLDDAENNTSCLTAPSPMSGTVPRTELEAASAVDGPGMAGNNADVVDTLSSPRLQADLEGWSQLTATQPGSPEGFLQRQQTQQQAMEATEGRSQAGPAGGASATGGPLHNHPSLAGYHRWPGASLLGALRRFARAEKLGSGEHWCCPGCGSRQRATKQLSVSLLPPLLTLHAKRFEHAGGARATAKKLETFLSFPMTGLDMRPYCSAAALRGRLGLRPPPVGRAGMAAAATGTPTEGAVEPRGIRAARSGGGGATSSKNASAAKSPITRTTSSARSLGAAAATPLPPHDGGIANDPTASVASSAERFLYDLFAVVCHRGTFQGGHYVCYVRCGDGRWYLCDDGRVEAAEEATVRNCQAYMLFYAQRGVGRGG
jgi:hypothetical protein